MTSSFIDTIKDLTMKAIADKEEKRKNMVSEKIKKFKEDNFEKITLKHHSNVMESIKRAGMKGLNERYINFPSADFDNDFIGCRKMLKLWLNEMCDEDSPYVPQDDDAVKLHFKGLDYNVWGNEKNTVKFSW